MTLPRNPWGEYKRQNPASAASISTLFFQVCFVAFAIAFTYYALKMKPFQTMASIPSTVSMEPAHPVSRHNASDERLLNRANKVAPLANIPSLPNQISLTGIAKKKIAVSRRTGS